MRSPAGLAGRVRSAAHSWFFELDDDLGVNVEPRSEESLAHYAALLEREALAADVPIDLLKAIAWYCSGWRQFEPSGRVLTTPGPNQGTCYGCMQLNDIWQPDAFPAALADAQANIRYAAKWLSWLHDQTGDWRRATIAFFGHDRRAELSERRVRRYMYERPWEARELIAGATPHAADDRRHA